MPLDDLRVLIGCECSGTVRDAFLSEGFDAWSCDLKPSEVPGDNRHILADIRDVLGVPEVYGRFDLVCVLHPPCTRLCNSGVRWLKKAPPGRTLEEMWQELDEGAALFDFCLNSYPAMVAVENPVMHKYAKERINFNGVKPFFVQPWQFGDDPDGPDNEKKRTGFWCRGLPKLEPTGTLDGTTARSSIHHASPGETRGAERSRFFPGMAKAIAQQWGPFARQNIKTGEQSS
jgi:hypothetical protein